MSLLICYHHTIQTIKILDFQYNDISIQGIQYLASVLKSSTVKKRFLLIDHIFTIIIQYSPEL
jgi:hypothetical protein